MNSAPVRALIEVCARMFPEKSVFVPKVAELPICQKIWQFCVSLIGKTLALLAVVRVLPIWKIKTLAGFP